MKISIRVYESVITRYSACMGRGMHIDLHGISEVKVVIETQCAGAYYMIHDVACHRWRICWVESDIQGNTISFNLALLNSHGNTVLSNDRRNGNKHLRLNSPRIWLLTSQNAQPKPVEGCLHGNATFNKVSLPSISPILFIAWCMTS